MIPKSNPRSLEISFKHFILSTPEKHFSSFFIHLKRELHFFFFFVSLIPLLLAFVLFITTWYIFPAFSRQLSSFPKHLTFFAFSSSAPCSEPHKFELIFKGIYSILSTPCPILYGRFMTDHSKIFKLWLSIQRRRFTGTRNKRILLSSGVSWKICAG